LLDLMNARPHMRNSVNLTPAEHRAYCEGYYCALVYSLRCLDLAVQNFELAKRTRRQAARRKVSA
jgi:hypothetical protein